MPEERIRPPRLSEEEKRIKNLGGRAVRIGSDLLNTPHQKAARDAARELRLIASELETNAPEPKGVETTLAIGSGRLPDEDQGVIRKRESE